MMCVQRKIENATRDPKSACQITEEKRTSFCTAQNREIRYSWPLWLLNVTSGYNKAGWLVWMTDSNASSKTKVDKGRRRGGITNVPLLPTPEAVPMQCGCVGGLHKKCSVVVVVVPRVALMSWFEWERVGGPRAPSPRPPFAFSRPFAGYRRDSTRAYACASCGLTVALHALLLCLHVSCWELPGALWWLLLLGWLGGRRGRLKRA
jgi:hypothetical protein